MTRWAILTGEYPPQAGGVSDYTRLVARKLAAAGDEVAVFAPVQQIGPEAVDPRVTVHRLPRHFGPGGLLPLDRELTRRPPDRILIQYVPHAFGWKAMNVPFAAWVAMRAGRIAPVWVMFHEVAFPFSWRPLKFAALGSVTEAMATWVAGAAERILISIPAWAATLHRLCPRARPAEWLPIPCSVATAADPAAVASVRVRYAPANGPLIGHFGTYGSLIGQILEPVALRVLVDSPDARLLLIGRGSEEFRSRLIDRHVGLASRVAATGGISEDGVAAHLQACDLVVQPYPDGVSSRRTSVMAAVANGVPVVTNLGHLSEPIWAETEGLALAAGPNAEAIAAAVLRVLGLTSADRAAMGARAANLYQSTFSLQHTVARLRNPDLGSR